MQNLEKLQVIIETAYENKIQLNPLDAKLDLIHAIDETIHLLNMGQVRVAEKINNQWQVNEWLKKAILLYFRVHENTIISGEFTQFYDKVPLKYKNYKDKSYTKRSTNILSPSI